jgi:DNA-binding response OmpR family regulator
MKQAREAGADDYLAKPFDVSELLLRVERALKSHTPTER